ncbi:copper chaperone PCu(A)C [Qipengyuania qiaonensis]|uniref:Copper chaperone PCu(A)C n=1 Tax=Qipengyuania qiaonensis TaxID=2867240 RepID=A0ABS7J297_9SPHN|nr:copper chaperone PCu(A)C [Qipengyuania qiaonensis]MBX7481448.1 copper chaperone PCu(A)C [Qipengyuania qiaonensis]
MKKLIALTAFGIGVAGIGAVTVAATTTPAVHHVSHAAAAITARAPAEVPVYLVLEGGQKTVSLVGARSPDAAKVQFVVPADDSSSVSISDTISNVEIPANGSITFEADGRHLMLKDLTPAARSRGGVDLMLKFSDGSNRTVRAVFEGEL